MRAVLDTNILISALLAPTGSPARVLRAWRDGRFEVVVSPKLLDELERALAYPKLRKRIAAAHATSFVAWLRTTAIIAPDVEAPPARTRDRYDDYLVALAASRRAALVSGDMHLLELRGRLPIFTAAGFLEWLGEQEASGGSGG